MHFWIPFSQVTLLLSWCIAKIFFSSENGKEGSWQLENAIIQCFSFSERCNHTRKCNSIPSKIREEERLLSWHNWARLKLFHPSSYVTWSMDGLKQTAIHVPVILNWAGPTLGDPSSYETQSKQTDSSVGCPTNFWDMYGPLFQPITAERISVLRNRNYFEECQRQSFTKKNQ